METKWRGKGGTLPILGVYGVKMVSSRGWVGRPDNSASAGPAGARESGRISIPP